MTEIVEDDISQTEPPELAPEPVTGEAPLFPWPPSEGTSVVGAFAQTVEQSVRTPSAFFRAMPASGYFSALSYFLIAGVFAAGLRLFWSNIFELIGYQPLTSQLVGLSSADPAQRLAAFLLQPLFLIGILFAVTLIVHASLHIVGAARAPLVTTACAFAFSYGPQLLVAIPFIGPIAATAGTLILFVIGLREAHQSTTRRVLLALALPVGVFLLLMLVALLLFVLLTLGAVATRIPL